MAHAPAVLLLVAVLMLTAVGSVAASQPNIVFILADDLGFNNIGAHNGVTLSPHIDDLFHNGLELNHSYAHKWCAPTRSSFMTGRLPYHTGIEHGELGKYASQEQYLALSQNWTFLPAALKQAGYSTHMLGKWNLGFWDQRYTPMGKGFDSYLGYLSADEQYFTHYKWPPFSGGPPLYNASLTSMFNVTDLTRDMGSADDEYQGVYSTYMYATEARRIIKAEAAKQQQQQQQQQQSPSPFFLYLAAQSIHSPLEAPDYYMELYPDAPSAVNNSDAQIVHAMVSALDDLVGNVTSELKSQGLWNNTIVIFGSDNGGDNHANNFPLRSGKFTTWEGGLRVVGAVSGGFLPSKCQGKVADGLVHIADWYPTFTALAGLPAGWEPGTKTAPKPMDGVDVWPYIASCGDGPSPRTELLHHYDGPTSGAFRQGDLKLIIGNKASYTWCWHSDYPLEETKTCIVGFGDPHPQDWVCTPCKKEGVNPCGDTPCLFNVSSHADPREEHDIAQDHPDIVEAMRSRYMELGADACTPAVGDCLEYIGHAAEVAWVAQTESTMVIQPLPNAGPPLTPTEFVADRW